MKKNRKNSNLILEDKIERREGRILRLKNSIYLLLN